MITSAPPEFILTDTTGVVIATSGSTASILSTSGASTGDVLTVQGDGSLNFATPVVTESLTDLDEWAANTLTVPGALTVRQVGGVAGTDEVQLYHDGTDGYVDSQSGDLIFNNSNAMVNSSGEFTNNAGYAETEVFGAGVTNVGTKNVVVGALANAGNRESVLVGYSTYGAATRNTCIGYNTKSSGHYGVLLGANVSSTTGYNINIGFNSTNSVFGTCLIGSDIILDFYWGDGITDTVPQDATLHATGGSGTDISGANLIHAGGRGTGSGLGGEVVIQHAPAGSTGTTLNTLEDIAFFGETIRFNNGNKVGISDYDFVPSIGNGLFTVAYNNEPNGIIELRNNGGVGNYGSTRIYAKTDASGFIIDNNKYHGTTVHHDYSARSAVRVETTNGTMAGSIFDVKAKLESDGSTWTSGLKYTWEDGLEVAGVLYARQYGGVAGTDEVQIYHDGTDAHIVPQSGALYFTSSGSDGPMVTADGLFSCGPENWLNGKNEFFGSGITGGNQGGCTAVGENAHSGGKACVAIGNSASAAAVFSTALGSNTDAYGSYGLAVGRSARATGYAINIGYNSTNDVFGTCLIGSDNIKDFYWGDGITDTVPQDATLHATGGSGTDISGANLILAGGKPTGAGTPGQVQFQIAPAGASGTTLGTLTTVGLFDEQGLTVRQPGGVAGTDEVQIYHSGADGYIESKSGNLIVPGSTTIQGTLLCDDFSVNYGDFTINSDTLYIYFDCDTNQNMQFRSTGGASFINQLVAKGTLIARQNGGVAGTDEVQIYHDGTDGYIVPQSGNLKVGSVLETQGWALNERSSDPSDPVEGQSIMWQSDGTGSGDDGDIMVKITAGGVTKTATLIDFSAI